MGHQPQLDRIGAVPPLFLCFPLGLAIGKYIHKFHQCDLCMTEIVLARPVLWLEKNKPKPHALRLFVPLASSAAFAAGF